MATVKGNPACFPARFTHLDALRPVHGDRIERLGPWLNVGDPLADAVVEAFARLPIGEGSQQLNLALERGVKSVRRPVAPLVELFDSLARSPLWLDWPELERGAAVYRSLGLFAQGVLICSSLPSAYASPAGCKPLTYTGRLVQRAFRRMAETGHYALATVAEGGLRPESAGFKITVHVRLMHAQVRRLLQQSKRWNPDWGMPINQVDLAGTNLTFSAVMLAGLRKLGYRLSSGEEESVMHLWRYAGHLMGVDPELQVATCSEGERLFDLIVRAQDPPDADSAALTRALLDVVPEFFGQSRQTRVGRGLRSFLEGLLEFLCGQEVARGLGVGRTPWRHAVPLFRLCACCCGWSRVMPGGRALALRLGTRRWNRLVERGLKGEKPQFGAGACPHAGG